MRNPILSTSEASQAVILPVTANLSESTSQAINSTNEGKCEPILSHELTHIKNAEQSASLTRWTWHRSSIRKVHYNNRIQEWIDHDQGFSNWIRSCLMFHADSGAFETKCTIPDQWREDIGAIVTIVTANAIPVRKGVIHEVKEGVFHVMG